MKKKRFNDYWKYIKNYKANSLFFRNLIVIFLLFLIPFILMSIIYYTNIERSAKSKLELENSIIIYEVRDVVDTIINEFDSMCSYVASENNVQMFMINDWYINTDLGQSADVLRTLNMTKYIYPYVDSIYVYSEYNHAIINDNQITPESDFKDMTWVKEYNRLVGRRGITVARSENGVFPLIISIIKPIYVDNEKKGAVIFNINSSKLYRSINNIHYDDEQSIYLINNEGNIIMTKNEQHFGKPVKSIDFLSDISENSNGFIRKIEGVKCLVSSVPSEKFDFFYINISPGTAYINTLKHLKIQIIIISLLILLISAFLSYIITLNNYRPITEIISVLDNPSNFNLSTDMNKYNELRYISKNIIENNKESALIQKKLEEQLQKLKNAQLETLQAQINPHFLYNTLETINWMAVDLTMSSNAVSKAVSNLAKFFRFNMSDGDYLIPISEEIQRTKYYLDILELRYSDMFTVSWDIDNTITDYSIVKISLQPIIENAVYHGLKAKGSNGKLTISGKPIKDDILFVIEDDGVGMPKEQTDTLNDLLQQEDYVGTSHIGLYNINKRLKIIFGENYGITVESKLNVGTRISIKIPKIIL